MKLLLSISLLLFSWHFSHAQNNPDDPEYQQLVDSGLASLKKGDCHSGLAAYLKAFTISNHSSLSHFRAAACAQSCDSLALASALISKASELNWEQVDQILSDSSQYPEVSALRRPDAASLITLCIQKAAASAGYNYTLAKILDTLRFKDQYYRHVYDEYRSKYAVGSAELKAFEDEYRQSDSLCILRVEGIFKQYGYPGKSMVGIRRQDYAWLVLQHAPLEKQEKYFPLVDEAAKKGELPLRAWAYLLDRIRMYKGQPQVYGSQVVRDETTGGWKFHEIEDESHVNERRKEVGLGPIEEYAERMGVNLRH